MSLHSVAEILSEHVALELEGIDRMYLNLYVPRLQCEQGVVRFFRIHRGLPFASSAVMEPITKGFIAATGQFAKDPEIPVLTFQKGQRKDDIAVAYRAKFEGEEGILFGGKAQEKTAVFRTERRCNPANGKSYPWIVRATAMVNHFYWPTLR